MRPNLRPFIRRIEVESSNNLIQRIEEIEVVQLQLHQDHKTEGKMKQPTSTIQPA